MLTRARAAQQQREDEDREERERETAQEQRRAERRDRDREQRARRAARFNETRYTSHQVIPTRHTPFPIPRPPPPQLVRTRSISSRRRRPLSGAQTSASEVHIQPLRSSSPHASVNPAGVLSSNISNNNNNNAQNSDTVDDGRVHGQRHVSNAHNGPNSNDLLNDTTQVGKSIVS